MKLFLITALMVLASALSLPASAATVQQTLVIKALAEKKVTELPVGPLFWTLENFPALTDAQAAAGPHGLAIEAAGKAWLITLGPASLSSGGTKIAQIGPLPNVVAKLYILRINEASGPPGSITPVHSHPGSEAFYVLAGETSSHTSQGVVRVRAGETATGHRAGTPMRVSSSGATNLHSLVMFVVDAEKPFSSPAKLP